MTTTIPTPTPDTEAGSDAAIMTARTTSATAMAEPSERSRREARSVRHFDILRGEWVKFRSIRSTRFTLAGAAVATVVLGMVFSATASSGEPAPGPAAMLSDPVDLALGAVDLAAMIIGVLGVIVVAGEYSTGLIRTTIAAVGNRLAVLRAKAVVLATTTAAALGAATVLALWLGQAVYTGDDPTLALTDADTIGVVVGTTAYVTGIALIGLALGTILRSTASSIGILVGGIFIGPQLMRLLPDGFTERVLKYLPSEAGAAMMSRVSDPDLLSTGAAYAVFAAWIIFLLGMAGLLLRLRDA